MNAPASELLRMLASAVRPAEAKRTAPPSSGQLQGADFASLLQRAEAGELSSGRPVTIAKGAGVRLSAEQLSRLAGAADRAEAAGATRALALVDGIAVRLDLSLREVTGQVDLASGRALTGVDAVIAVPAAAQDAPAGAQGPGASVPWSNASLLRVLAQGSSTSNPPAA